MACCIQIITGGMVDAMHRFIIIVISGAPVSASHYSSKSISGIVFIELQLQF